MELGSSPSTEGKVGIYSRWVELGHRSRKFIKKGDSSSGDQASWTLAESKAGRLGIAWVGGGKRNLISTKGGGSG